MGRVGRILRRIRALVVSRPTAFSWVYPGKLAASGLPSTEGQMRWLSSQGITSILSLTEMAINEEWARNKGIEVGHVPMVDHDPPTKQALDEAASFVEDEIGGGRTVLVHCLAGKGRTGTVLAAYLMKYKGMRDAEAVEFVRRLRPGSIEPAQLAALKEYQLFLEKHGPRSPGYL